MLCEVGERVANTINQAGKGVLKDLNERMILVGRTVLRDAVKECPVDLGQLRASGRIEKTEEGVKVSFNTEYAYYVHEGTGVYTPGGRKAPWKYPYKDGFRVTKGQKPNKFLKRALDKNKGNITKILKG